MGKKKKHEEHENLERWLVSYADFITLLFATFTALYALSVADLAKMKDVAQSIRDGFQEQSLISGIESIIQGKPSSSNPVSTQKGEGDGLLGKHESLTYTKGEVKKAKNTVANLKKAVADINAAINAKFSKGKGKGADGAGVRGVELAVQERGIRVSFDSTLLFEPGSATLKSESKKALDAIADNLKSMSATNFIHIEGHTDNQRIASALYPSNWELSAARSSTVVRYLISNHSYRGDHLAAVGYGDTRPFTSNVTPQGRAMNRRIDIIVYSQLVGKAVDVSSQYSTEDTLIKAVDQENNIKVIIHHDDKPQPGDGPTIQEDSLRDSTIESNPKIPIKPGENDPEPVKEDKPAASTSHSGDKGKKGEKAAVVHEEIDLGKFKPKRNPGQYKSTKAKNEHDSTVVHSQDQ